MTDQERPGSTLEQPVSRRAASAAVAGLELLQNALTGFCGGNLLFGIDTTADFRAGK